MMCGFLIYFEGKEPEITVEEGCRCSNGVHEFVSKKRLADDIIPHILNMYVRSLSLGACGYVSGFWYISEIWSLFYD